MEMFILGMIVGVALSWFIVRLLVEHAVQKVRRELGVDFDQVIDHMEKELKQADRESDDADKIKITLERHNNTYLVYDKDTSQFMAQGHDYWDLMNKLNRVYPEQLFEIVDGDKQVVEDFMSTSEKTGAV